MKKIFIAFSMTLIIFSLSACGLGEEGTLRVGMDLSYPPFETEDENRDPYGISVDIAQEFADYLGRDLVVVDTGFGSLIPSLNSGEIDIVIASMSITEERAKSVDFSDPYLYFKIISLLNQDFADTHNFNEDTTSEDLLDIEDAKYVGLADQISYEIPQSMGYDTLEASNLSTAVLEIVQGNRDILMMSPFPVMNNHTSNEASTVPVWAPITTSPIGMAVRQGDSDMLEEANAFIAQMDEDGGVYDRLRANWDDHIQSQLVRYGLDFFIYED